MQKPVINISINKLFEKIEVNTSDNKNLDDIGNMVTEELLQAIKSVNNSKNSDTDVLKELLAPVIREVVNEMFESALKEVVITQMRENQPEILSTDQKPVYTRKVNNVRFDIKTNTLEEALEVIAKELEKYPNEYRFQGFLMGLAKSELFVLSSDNGQEPPAPDQK